MDLAVRKLYIIEKLMRLVNPEKLDKIEAFLAKEIFQKEGLEISDAHKEILDQRLASHKENPNTGRSWEEIKAELSQKYAS